MTAREPPDVSLAATTAADRSLDATVASASDVGVASTPSAHSLAKTNDRGLRAGAVHFPELGSARYVLADEVGRGGLGRVVAARDQLLERTVAIKELQSHDASTQRRFVREALITARLQHPAIIPIYEAGHWKDGSPFYAMRLVRGRPFGTAITEARTLTGRLALLPVMLAVADAIAYAHSERIIHRDLKPANILVGEFGETVVIDWGLAKDLATDDPDALEVGPYRAVTDGGEHTAAGVVMGTPAYMAPEQAAGEDVDERTDVYALGAILYHVIAGATPHEGKTLDAVIQRILEGALVPLAERETHTPPDLAAIVGKAMARDRTRRYRTAQEFADELRRFLNGQLVASHHYTFAQRVRRFVHKHRAPVATAAIALAVIAVGGVFAIKRVLDERDTANTQRDIAENRAHKLQLAQARDTLASDPSAAIALARPLVTTDWREARAIGAAARAAGVPIHLPGSPHTTSLALAEDGHQALAAGDDGVIRIYDLVHRTSRVILDAHGPAQARFVEGDHAVIVTAGTHVAIVEATGSLRRRIEAPTPVAHLTATDNRAFWVDTAGAIWSLYFDDAPRRVEAEEPARDVLLSPDGRWLAVRGEHHLLLGEARGDKPLHEVTQGDPYAWDFALERPTLLALVRTPTLDEAAMVDLDADNPMILSSNMLPSRFYGIAAHSRTMFVAGPIGVFDLSEGGLRKARLELDRYPLGIGRTGAGLVAVGEHGLALIFEEFDQIIKCPSVTLERFASTTASSFVVGAAAGEVVVWDLAQVRPRVVVEGEVSHVRFDGNDHLLVDVPDEPSRQFDVAGPGERVASGAAGASGGRLSAAAGLRVEETRAGRLEVFDTASTDHWAIELGENRTFDDPQISPDGHHVVALVRMPRMAEETRDVLLWTLDLPDSAEATARWLGAMVDPIIGPVGDPVGEPR